MYYHKLQKISVKREVVEKGTFFLGAVSVLDRDMGKKNSHMFGKIFVWKRYRIGITY